MAKKKENFRSVEVISKELDVVDNFVLKNWKRYTVAGIIIVVIAGIVLFWYETKRTNSIKMSESLAAATTAFELKSLIEEYPDYKITDFARLRLAAILFNEGKYKDALNIYNKDIKKSSTGYASALGKINKSYALESEGKNEEAMNKMINIASDKKIPDIFRCEAYYSAGRLAYSLNKPEQALDLLNKCIAEKQYCQFWPEMAKKLQNRIKPQS